jgi:LysR family transcriptional regulator, low CO2-responsive transcriptional regulator
LLEQVNGRLCPTVAGQKVLHLCEEVFTALSALELTLADYQDLQKGTLRLTLDTTAQYLILPILRPFRDRYPGIRISLEISNGGGAMERLRNNCDDLYILNDPPETEEIETKPFLDNPLVGVAPSQHSPGNPDSTNLYFARTWFFNPRCCAAALCATRVFLNPLRGAEWQ